MAPSDSNIKKAETLGGYIVHNLPFPNQLDEQSLGSLKNYAPLQFEQDYAVTYLHSYAQDSPFFAGLTNKVILGNRDLESGYTYATPRGHDMFSGQETEWVVLPQTGTIHAFTTCHFGSEEFLPECPFTLILVEFEGANTLFLGRLVGVDPNDANLNWIGRKVQARFLRNAKLKPTDVYFTLVER